MIKGKEKRQKKYISLMMVPYNSSRIRSIRISHLYAKLVSAIILISLAVVSVGVYIDKTLEKNALLQSEVTALSELSDMQEQLLAEQGISIEEGKSVVDSLKEDVEKRDTLIATHIEDLFKRYKDLSDQYILGKINASIASRSGTKVDATTFAAEIKELKQTLLDLKELAASAESPDFDISESTDKLEEYLSYIPTKWPLDD